MIINLFVSEVKGDFRIQPDEVNILCDVTDFLIDKRYSDVIIPAYNQRFGGDNLKWR
jgi:hypothetical protein